MEPTGAGTVASMRSEREEGRPGECFYEIERAILESYHSADLCNQMSKHVNV